MCKCTLIQVEELQHLDVTGITAWVKFVKASGEGQHSILLKIIVIIIR
jgi:hypothetical protein